MTAPTPEQEKYMADLAAFMEKDKAGTLTLAEELVGLCRFSWINLAGFNDPNFTGYVVYADDVLEILKRHAEKRKPDAVPVMSQPVFQPQVCTHCGGIGHLMEAHF